MPRRCASRPAQAGFALLETLVALSLAALLIGAVLQSVRWVSMVSGFGNRVAQVAALEAGATALTDLLAAAVLTNQPAPPFAGDETGFAFDTVSDGTVTTPGHVHVTVSRRVAGGGRLEFAASFAPASGEGPTATTAALLRVDRCRGRFPVGSCPPASLAHFSNRLQRSSTRYRPRAAAPRIRRPSSRMKAMADLAPTHPGDVLLAEIFEPPAAHGARGSIGRLLSSSRSPQGGPMAAPAPAAGVHRADGQ